MPHPFTILGAGALCATLAAAPLVAQDAVGATADFTGLDGASLGAATLTQGPNGVLIRAELTGLPEGAHGFHIHAAGSCEPPFDSAGPHFNPAQAPHGLLAAGGPDAGDLPNIDAPASGALVVEAFAPLVSLVEGRAESLLDDDGSALVIHAERDDYMSQPSGQSGDRIACAVIK